MKSKKYHKNT